MPPCYLLNNSIKINQFNFFCYKESEKTLLQKPVHLFTLKNSKVISQPSLQLEKFSEHETGLSLIVFKAIKFWVK